MYPFGNPLFDTSVYETIKNSGVLIRLTEETVDSIGRHYDMLKTINREIKRRYDLQIPSNDDEKRLIEFDHEICQRKNMETIKMQN